jgi:hypothetical protein
VLIEIHCVYQADLEELPMPDFESPMGALDLRDPSNCLKIAMAKPGEEIRVIVRGEDNATEAKLMEGMGTLSNDGKSFFVVVTRENDTQQTYDLCYRDFLKAFSDLS